MSGLIIALSTAHDGPWCGDCPLWDGEWGTCQVSGHAHTSDRSDSDADDGSPKWCPLRAGSVTVRAVDPPTVRAVDPPKEAADE